MSRFSIGTKSGRLRAESDDGETVTLYIWDKAGFTGALADHMVTVKLADLRQIVSHFDWLESDGGTASDRKEQTEHVGLTLEIDTEMLAKAVARQLAKQVRLRPTNR